MIIAQHFVDLHYRGSEYQAEVAILSRNILITSDAASVSSQLGGHIQIMGQGRMGGMMTYRLGQANTMGTYPIHFHLAGDQPTSIVTDCTIYRSLYKGGWSSQLWSIMYKKQPPIKL